MAMTLLWLTTIGALVVVWAVAAHLLPDASARERPPRERCWPQDARRRAWEAAALRWVYHWRNWLVGPPLLYALVSFDHEVEADWAVWPLALGLVSAGLGMRVWAQMHIRFRLGMRRNLATTGPYAIVRNPLYIANTLICAGAVAASELLWLVPVAVLWCAVVYSMVVRQEEARLLAKYGDAYRGYALAVPRWAPWTQALARGVGARSVGARAFLGRALVIELPCLLILVPYVAKEIGLVSAGW